MHCIVLDHLNDPTLLLFKTQVIGMKLWLKLFFFNLMLSDARRMVDFLLGKQTTKIKYC